MSTAKKLLLVKPNYFHFPLGLAYVCRELQVNDIPFDFIDTSIDKLNVKKLLDTNEYFAVATGGLSANWKFMRDLRVEVKKYAPEMPFILGGNVVKDTIYTDSSILFKEECFGIDFGIHGEAEGALAPLLNAILENQKDYSKLPGIIYFDKKTGMPKKNPKYRFDFNKELRLPMWEAIDVEFYKNTQIPFYGKVSLIPIVSGRGCDGVCSFCSPTIGRFKKRPVEHIMQEIEWLEENYEFDALMFLNEMFYDLKEDIVEFCEAYKKRFSKPWFAAFRAEIDIDVATFNIMKEAGCIKVGAGVESGSDHVLKLMKKLTPAAKIADFFTQAKMSGIPSAGTFIVGNEGETEEDLKKTIDMVIENDIYCDAALMNAYPGTLAYKHALERGLIKDEWYYLTQVTFRYGLWGHDLANEYVNISDIPDNVFWITIYRQLRRFETHFYNKYTIKNLKWQMSSFLLRKDVADVSGQCVSCGNTISTRVQFNLLGQTAICNHCSLINYINYYNLPELHDHYESLKNKLSSSKRLLFVGSNKSIIRYDLFGIDYDNTVLGFLEMTDPVQFRPYSKDNSLRSSGVQSVLDLKPDLILIVEDSLLNVEYTLKKWFSDVEGPLPEILNVLPVEYNRSVKYVEYFNLTSINHLIYSIKHSYLSMSLSIINQLNTEAPSFTRSFLQKILPPSVNTNMRHFIRRTFKLDCARSSK